MTYIWRAQKFKTRFRCRVVLHIQLPSVGHPAAICGTLMKFNQSANASYNPSRPVCKNCLRSCVDQRIAA